MEKTSFTRIALTGVVGVFGFGLGGGVTVADAKENKAKGVHAIIERFEDNPLGKGERFQVRGPAAALIYNHDSDSHFAGDKEGSLTVIADSLQPTTRLYSTFRDGARFTQNDDFTFGAVLTIRPDGYAADPDAAAQIAFQLLDSRATGDERTGNITDFNVNTFDMVEFDYFPNVSAIYGGPFISPTVFGDPIGSTAFNDFSFASTQAAFRLGAPYLIVGDYSAAKRQLTVQAWELHARGPATPLAGSLVTVNVAGVRGFSVDSLGVAAYHDGFNEFAPTGRSLYAKVEYDLLFASPANGEHGEDAAELIAHLKSGRHKD